MTKGDGLPCKKCGTSEWYENSNCKHCAISRTRKWREENPDKAKENRQRWRKENPEGRREQRRRYYRKNQKELNIRRRGWRQSNRERCAEHSRRWRKNNPEGSRNSVRKWHQANPQKISAIKNRRRTQKTQAGGSYTAAEWKALCELYDNRCLCCGEEKKLTFDHVIPVSAGGTSNINNGQPLCLSCNDKKGTKTTDYRTKPTAGRWKQPALFD